MVRWLIVLALACICTTARADSFKLVADSANPQLGTLAAASVAGNSLGSCNVILTLTADRYTAIIVNSLNQAIEIAYAGANMIRLPANISFVIDIRVANLKFLNTKTLCVYYTGAAPTTGELSITTF